MARNLSADEVEKQHVHAMGATLGPLYHALYNEVTWIHAKWIEYRKLYAHSPKRVEALNKAAGFFFWFAEVVLRENVLLHIARLTDPPKQGKYDNLTLLRLPGAICEASLRTEVEALVADAIEKAAFARAWRNRRIAHSDLALALDKAAETLPAVSRQKVGEVLSSFAGVLNRLNQRYLDGGVAFEHFISPLGDADALVHHLRVSLRHQERKLQRLRARSAFTRRLRATP